MNPTAQFHESSLTAEQAISNSEEATRPPIQRQQQRPSDMSNEDNDDLNDTMDESAARGTAASGIQALGMNGSELNGKGDAENIINELDKDDVASDDGAEEDYQEEDDDQLPVVATPRAEEGGGGGGGRRSAGGGFWGGKGRPKTIVASSSSGGGIIGVDGNQILGNSSRPASPGGLMMMDNLSDISSQLPITAPLARSKSRTEFSSAGGVSVVPSGGGGGGGNTRYSSNFWKARRVLLYRNGDPFFPGIEYRFKPGRDVTTIEALLDKVSPRMDLPRGARFIFSMDGDRKFSLDELEDGSSYVVSSFNKFKVKGYSDDLLLFFPLCGHIQVVRGPVIARCVTQFKDDDGKGNAKEVECARRSIFASLDLIFEW